MSSSNNPLLKNFPGIYRLVKRTLPDGKVLKGSNVQGTAVFSKDGHSAINITVHNPADDTYHMLAYQSDFSITDSEFTNTLKALASQYGKSSEPVHYSFKQAKKSSPVTIENESVPINQPAHYFLEKLTIIPNGFTTLRSGPLKGTTDEWEKIVNEAS